MASPFNLVSGSSVFVSIVCYNSVGNSQHSDVGSGAIIVVSTKPDAPINLVRNTVVVLDQTKISFTWSNGAFNGNQPVLDYRISYD